MKFMPHLHSALRAVSVLALVGASATAAHAQVTTNRWTGAIDTNWANSANWVGGSVAPTGGIYTNVRLEITNRLNNVAYYTAANGYTRYDNGTNARAILVGNTAGGTLVVQGGTIVTTSNSQGDLIGNGASITSTMIIDGGIVEGPDLNMGVGGGPNSWLIMSNGSATYSRIIGNSTAARVDLNGGTLKANTLANASSSFMQLRFNGGTLEARVSATNFIDVGRGSSGTVQIDTNGGTINTAGFFVSCISAVRHWTNLSSSIPDGGLIKNGAGRLTLTSTNTATATNNYNGPTTVNAGELFIEVAHNTPVTVMPGAGFGGEGSNSLGLVLDGTNALYFNPSTPSGLTVSNLTVNGDNIRVIPFGGSASGTGMVVLVSGTTIGGSPAQFTSPRGSVYFDGTSTQVLLDYAPGSLVWKGNDATNPTFWDSTTTNWLNGVTPDVFINADAATFDDSAASFTIAVQGSINPGSMTFNHSANNYTVNGGSISSSGALVKSGSGTLTLNQTNAHSGGTLINGGRVVASVTASLGTAPVTNNGILDLPAAENSGVDVQYTGVNSGISGTGVVNLTLGTNISAFRLFGTNSGFNGVINASVNPSNTSAGKLHLQGVLGASSTLNILTNGTVYTSGSLLVHPGAIVLGGGDTGEPYGQLRLDNGASWAGPVTLAGPITSTNDGHIGSFTGGPNTIFGSIGETNGPQDLVRSGGAGTVIIFSNANTYSGITYARAGVLRIANPLALGSTNAGVDITEGARIDMIGDITVTNESITIRGQAGNSGGGLQTAQGSNTWTGPVNIGSTNSRLGCNSSTGVLVVSGAIDDGTNAFDLTIRNVSATAVTVLMGSSTYNGTTYVVGGITRLVGGSDRLPPGSALHIGLTNVASVLDLNGQDQEVALLTNAILAAASEQITNSHPSLVSTFTVNDAVDSAFSGVICGPIDLVKSGSATFALTGTNAYQGSTTVNAGTLSIGNPFLSASNAVVIATNAVMDLAFVGTNPIGSLTLNGVAQGNGTYGATGSGAANINDTYFTGTGVLLVGPAGTAYDTWAAANGLDGSAGKETNFELDPENDGLASGLEWILGGLPLVRDAASVVPVPAIDTTNLVLTFTREDASEAETTLLAQWTTTLTEWSNVVVSATNSGPDANGVVITVTENGAAPDDITVSVPRANGVNGTLDARIKATKP